MKDLTEKCAWKSIAELENHAEGNLDFCKYVCNGYPLDCGHYVPESLINTIKSQKNTKVQDGNKRT